MSYATNTDLLLEFKGLAAAGWNSQTVSAATVDEWCTQASNKIDAMISGKYRTPVDATASPNAFSVLKNACIELVKPRIQGVLRSQTGGKTTSTSAGGDNDPTKGTMAFLKQVQSGDVKLSDAVLASSADGVESFTNDNAQTTQPPVFGRRKDQW